MLLSFIFVRFTYLKSRIQMKKIGLVLCFFLTFYSSIAQETYTIEGETLELKTEIEGELDLLSGVIEGRFHFYVRTSDNVITELVNTKIGRHNYLKEYRETLENLTNRSAFDVDFNLGDLKTFIDDYNASQDSNYERFTSKNELMLMLEFFGGITNSPLVFNENNSIALQFGAELQISTKTSKHALFVRSRYVFKTDDFEYSTTEFALGYRFRVVNTESLKLFAQTKFATLNLAKNTVPGPNDTLVNTSDSVFDIPFTFGIGADIKVSQKSFITVRYNELFAVLNDNQDNFSTNLTLGYKFSL